MMIFYISLYDIEIIDASVTIYNIEKQYINNPPK